MRVEEAEREVETLREDLAQAQQRINTLLEMNQPGFHMDSEDEGDDHQRRRNSAGSSEEASMAFDKVSLRALDTGQDVADFNQVNERTEAMGALTFAATS